jgi:hypothetical protein
VSFNFSVSLLPSSVDYLIGMVKLKVVPIPRDEVTSIFPPNAVTICYEITSPRPIPFLFILWVSYNFPNRLKSLSIPSYEIPTPVSLTLIVKSPFSTLTSMETFPSTVNLSALDCRFKTTC